MMRLHLATLLSFAVGADATMLTVDSNDILLQVQLALDELYQPLEDTATAMATFVKLLLGFKPHQPATCDVARIACAPVHSFLVDLQMKHACR